MPDLYARIATALASHPTIRGVELAGSRARGEQVALSDWDFAVDCTDFERAARDLPGLVRPLEPLSEQWDRLSPFPTYMLMLRGPLKVDLLFPTEPRPQFPPWTVSGETLGAIDDHFWDWALWLASKEQAGDTDRVARELGKLFEHLLEPMGAKARPSSIAAAVGEFSARRDGLERRLDLRVRRDLDREVRRALRGAGHAV